MGGKKLTNIQNRFLQLLPNRQRVKLYNDSGGKEMVEVVWTWPRDEGGYINALK